MRKPAIGIALLLLAGLTSPAAQAGGPGLSVTTAGVPFKWNTTQPIVFNMDRGPLGRLNNREASQIVLNAFAEWQKIETANLQFEEGDLLEVDVTGQNLGEFLGGLPSDVNPVIFDNDGSITQGNITNPERAFAWGGTLQSTPTGRIAQGFIVVNARAMDGLFNPDDPTQQEMTRAVVRAIGQMLNLGSSDLNDELIYDGNVANNSAVPIMHPGTAIDAVTVIGGGFTPTLDDRMAISTLYPSTSFEANTGVIRGQVTLPDGTTGLQGVTVVARKVDDPLNSAVSTITGNTFRNVNRGGSTDPSLRGAFEMRVPPGSYTVEIRSLRAGIGPLQEITVLPGGTQYYQETPAPAAGPADPASATPLTVTAGQPTEIKLTAIGQPAPAPQAITEAEPNDSPAEAPLLPLSATVTGNLTNTDPGTITIDAGGGDRDDIEDLYRLVVTEQSLLIMRLESKEKVDVDLWIFAGLQGGAAPISQPAWFIGPEPEAMQILLGPGTYYIGVTAWDADNPAPTEYTLSVTTTPAPSEARRALPILDRLVIGDVTATAAEARWLTDRDATADTIVGLPRRQFGDPAAAMTHRVALTELTAGALATVRAVSQAPGGGFDSFPQVFFRTADATAVEGPAKLNATVVGAQDDFISLTDVLERTRYVAISIHNTGGNAANVQLTGLTASPGWRLATPVTEPIAVGAIGSGGTALVIVRLRRDGTGTEPISTVTGTGTVAGADGAAVNFTIGGP